MAKEVVNESSAFTLRTRFFGTGGSQTPASLRYLIRDVSNNRVVRDWTILTPGTFVDIFVSAPDNEIYEDQSRRRGHFEERVVSIQANYDTDSQYADEYRYLVKNLRGFES
jgi:hypothetical protein